MREEQRTQENAISQEQKKKVSQKWTAKQRGSGGEWKEKTRLVRQNFLS